MDQLWIAFLMGFLGSAHCVGMCGGFALLAGATHGGVVGQGSRLLAYFSGKTVTYAGAGGVLGLLGSTVPTAFSEFQTVVAVSTGLLLLLIGGHMIGLGPAWILVMPVRASVLVSRMVEAVRRSSVPDRFTLGLLNGLIPCGLVYAALGYSLTFQDPVRGAMFMAIFGVGTVPALAFMGFGSAFLTSKRRAGVVNVLGWVVILLGIVTIVRATPLMKILMGGM